MALVTLTNSNGQTITTEEGGVIYESYLFGSHSDEGWRITSNAPASSSSSTSLTLENLLADSRVSQDLGHNNVTMGQWLQGNASLLPQLANLGYTITDMVNEAYSQTRTNTSAFSQDMTQTSRDDNSAATAAITAPNPSVDPETETSTDTTASTSHYYVVKDGILYDMVTEAAGEAFIENGQYPGSLRVSGDLAFLEQQYGPVQAAPVVETVAPAPSETPVSSIIPDTVDLSGLTADQIRALEDWYTQSTQNSSLTNTALSTVGDIVITDEDMQRYLEEATEFYTGEGSYYAQTFQRLSESFQLGLEKATADREQALEQEALNAQLAQEALSAESAEAGLATSGIRREAEQRLAAQSENIAASSRRQFEFDVENAGRSAEDVLGSSTIAGLTLPTLEDQAIFTPGEDVRGSLERELETNIQLKADELAEQIAEGRAESLAAQGETSIYA